MASHIYTKSELILSDQGSKYGTNVDGEVVKGDSVRLTEDEHTIKLGNCKSALRIKWEPTVLTFSFSSKELKAKDPLASVRSRLEDLDIKTIVPYVIGHTTHVVQNKRNTAKGLQALVNGKHIVHESYLDALVYAATPSDLENLESLSPLEEDFEAAWPDPREHLPPPGKEVVQRPAEAFAPNPDRITVFEGYTFVFGDAAQCDNLREPITNGHGKVLLYQIENGVTTADEIVQFMRNAAGDKGLGSQREGPGGVVYVRYRAKGRYEDWSIELSTQIARETNQRVIEQSEFLDAILGCDASPLCRSLPEEESPQEADAGQPSRLTESVTPAPSADGEMVADLQPSQEMTQHPEPKLKIRGWTSMPSQAFEPAEDGGNAASPPPMELGVLEAARQHREAEEDAERQRREEEEAELQSSLREVEKLKGLAIVEEMEIKPRHHDVEESRWDERWNGRKNFKKFRRRDDANRPRHRIQTVIVPLEEVTRKGQGMSDQRWSGSSREEPSDERDPGGARSPSRVSLSRSGSRVESQAPSQSQSQSQVSRSVSRTASVRQKRGRDERESDSDDELRFRFRRRR
ncbi:predicted protein [Aspergillus terreus NIH2624]|uniref:Nibrin second BRCT domain-containing protein n=1 Tax=Aspergillus terreus (strain NIH 2624 / FGSC A1156) TaxID=341663 RepID=Q0CC96_ASPTN|nr:uncharacterized protein ATEG_08688 [Aspergillus terreus NIH2624]EAU30820.1 predicted protein [Aspergillus terreus NIH2624]